MPGKILRGIALALVFLWGKEATLISQSKEGLLEELEAQALSVEPGRLSTASLEQWQDLTAEILDLNQATYSELEASGLFTAYQIDMLLDYRDQFGPLLSIYELSCIKGFRSDRLKVLESKLRAGKSPQKRSTANRYRGRVMISRKFPLSRAYLKEDSSPVYKGSPWRMGVGLQAKLKGRLDLALSLEKDPGESFWTSVGPEFMGGYVHFRGEGKLQQLILGRYKLNLGAGLQQGSSLMHSTRDFNRQIGHSHSLRPYGGWSESGIQQGYALSLKQGPLRLIHWSSAQAMDLSLSTASACQGVENLSECWRQDGLHRSLNEREGRALAHLLNTGLHLACQLGRLELAVQSSIQYIHPSRSLRDSVPGLESGSIKFPWGMHGRWLGKSLELHFEWIPWPARQSAVQTGLRFRPSDFLHLGCLAYRFGAEPPGPFSSAYQLGPSPDHEQGMLVHVHAEPLPGLTTTFCAESFERRGPSHASLLPNRGWRWSLYLENPAVNDIQYRLKYRQSLSQSTPPMATAGYRSFEHSHVQEVDFLIRVLPIAHIRFDARTVLKHDLDDAGDWAQAMVLQVAWDMNLLKLRCQFVAFDVPRWKLRMAFYEPGLYREFRFPTYGGKGQKCSLMLRCELGKHCVLEARYSLLSSHDSTQLGSGYERMPGSKRHEAGLQVRVSL